jgi:hypothetical protein
VRPSGNYTFTNPRSSVSRSGSLPAHQRHPMTAINSGKIVGLLKNKKMPTGSCVELYEKPQNSQSSSYKTHQLLSTESRERAYAIKPEADQSIQAAMMRPESQQKRLRSPPVMLQPNTQEDESSSWCMISSIHHAGSRCMLRFGTRRSRRFSYVIAPS